MKTVFLVPRRDDGGHRDALWEWCRRRWEAIFPEIRIFEGHHRASEGQFNRSAAINRAARLADADGQWDLAIVIDSDVFLKRSQVKAAISRASKTGRVTWAHRRWRGLAPDHTRRAINPKNPHDFGPEIDRDDMDIWIERTTPISWSCCVVIPRSVWEATGGFDERFVGWGFEDGAWAALVKAFHGWERIDGDVYHLHHPRSGERIVKGEPAETASAEYLTNARLGRRYMVAVIRDHGVGDQPGEERMSKALRAKHVANLKRDDAKLARAVRRFGLPDWDDWWPTLEELRDGSIAHIKAERLGTVTVIVHTGGDPANWPERRRYLQLSLPSLAARVTGPIVQRVIYDCWGDDEIRAELEALGHPFGFYVVGPSERPDFTGSMRAMWRYLARRAKGRYILQVEDDFTYERDVDLVPMIETLRDNPELVQVALLRDACYPDERETGGILGWPLPAFTFKDNRAEHRLFWTNNPSLFRKTITDREWPLGHHSETLFGNALFADPDARAAFWGDASEPWIRHVGEVRAGSGY